VDSTSVSSSVLQELWVCGNPSFILATIFLGTGFSGIRTRNPRLFLYDPRCVARYLINMLYTTRLRFVRVRGIGMMLPMSTHLMPEGSPTT